MNILDELGITKEQFEGPIEPPIENGVYNLNGIYELTIAQYDRIRKHNARVMEEHKQNKQKSKV